MVVQVREPEHQLDLKDEPLIFPLKAEDSILPLLKVK
jgi:hypothetical protein